MAAILGFVLPARAQLPAPEALIDSLSSTVLADIKADTAIQAGDVDKVLALVDAKVMPHVDLRRMTSSALGRYWRQASPQQRLRLQDEFKRLVLRTYAGALTQVTDQTVRLLPRPRAAGDTQAMVRTEIRGHGDPVRIDYRLHQTPAGWKIYDLSVVGVWLAQNYRNSFAREIGMNGIDGLIAALAEKNRGAGKP
ncbi:MAG: ABC transporter substrate-binding protein [Burkholderiaceae bacterium]|nr:ABC transporter substrate-binding protein [Burkholderiaceae bacterium]